MDNVTLLAPMVRQISWRILNLPHSKPSKLDSLPVRDTRLAFVRYFFDGIPVDGLKWYIAHVNEMQVFIFLAGGWGVIPLAFSV